MNYKLYIRTGLSEPDAAYYTDKNGRMVSFIFDPDNTDYQAYLKWLEEGNTPEPADGDVVDVPVVVAKTTTK